MKEERKEFASMRFSKRERAEQAEAIRETVRQICEVLPQWSVHVAAALDQAKVSLEALRNELARSDKLLGKASNG